jgi:aryl-alcohol dehydrogenase-like predicted oxidoreductase
MANADSLPPGRPSKDELKRALKAFKKRLKLTRLDAESQISGGPLSGGRDSGIVAIQPPNEFPQTVWDELVRQGKLKSAGHGTYEVGEASA